MIAGMMKQKIDHIIFKEWVNGFDEATGEWCYEEWCYTTEKEYLKAKKEAEGK